MGVVMAITELQFFSILKHIVQLYESVRIYNTSFVHFKYELSMENDSLKLTCRYPVKMDQEVLVLTQDKFNQESYDRMLTLVDAFLKAKAKSNLFVVG